MVSVECYGCGPTKDQKTGKRGCCDKCCGSRRASRYEAKMFDQDFENQRLMSMCCNNNLKRDVSLESVELEVPVSGDRIRTITKSDNVIHNYVTKDQIKCRKCGEGPKKYMVQKEYSPKSSYQRIVKSKPKGKDRIRESDTRDKELYCSDMGNIEKIYKRMFHNKERENGMIDNNSEKPKATSHQEKNGSSRGNNKTNGSDHRRNGSGRRSSPQNVTPKNDFESSRQNSKPNGVANSKHRNGSSSRRFGSVDEERRSFTKNNMFCDDSTCGDECGCKISCCTKHDDIEPVEDENGRSKNPCGIECSIVVTKNDVPVTERHSRRSRNRNGVHDFGSIDDYRLDEESENDYNKRNTNGRNGSNQENRKNLKDLHDMIDYYLERCKVGRDKTAESSRSTEDNGSDEKIEEEPKTPVPDYNDEECEQEEEVSVLDYRDCTINESIHRRRYSPQKYTATDDDQPDDESSPRHVPYRKPHRQLCRHSKSSREDEILNDSDNAYEIKVIKEFSDSDFHKFGSNTGTASENTDCRNKLTNDENDDDSSTSSLDNPANWSAVAHKSFSPDQVNNRDVTTDMNDAAGEMLFGSKCIFCRLKRQSRTPINDYYRKKVDGRTKDERKCNNFMDINCNENRRVTLHLDSTPRYSRQKKNYHTEIDCEREFECHCSSK